MLKCVSACAVLVLFGSYLRAVRLFVPLVGVFFVVCAPWSAAVFFVHRRDGCCEGHGGHESHRPLQ